MEEEEEKKKEDQVLQKLNAIDGKLERIVDLLDVLVTLARKAASFSSI